MLIQEHVVNDRVWSLWWFILFYS